MHNEIKATNSVNNTFCVNPATRYPIKQALATTKAKCNHLYHVTTQIPYALVVASACN